MEINRTPFVKQKSGGSCLFLIKDKAIQFGHRFDAVIGYRLYIKYVDSNYINAFTSKEARRAIIDLRRDETNEVILLVADKFEEINKEIEILNKAWKLCGSQPAPLTETQESGHA